MEPQFASRRRKLLKQIPNEAALFVAPSVATASRDVDKEFFQNPDLFYLTGFSEPDCALLLIAKSQGPRSILYLRERDPQKEVWTGERLGIKRARQRFTIDEVRNINELESDLYILLKQTRALHYALGLHPEVDRTVVDIMSSNLGPRFDFPNQLKDSRLITSEMRFVKERDEVKSLKHVADITAYGFLALLPELKRSTSELHAARTLEAHFTRLGSNQLAFPTIVASGKHATCLHHSPTLHPLWKRELVLIDAGARFQGYCGDITRTVPVSGKFPSPHAEVYDVVQQALKKACEKAAPEVTMDAIHQVAVKELTKGLIELGILKGEVSENVSKGTYKKFFMHRTGHFLGLDVHDISPVRYNAMGVATHPYSLPLQPGNVFTVEPGLYFDPKDQSIPKHFRGIGIRIEDDVLITSNGHTVLTSSVPSEREALEALIE